MENEQKELFEIQVAEDLKNKEAEAARLIKSIEESEQVFSEMEQAAALWAEAIEKYSAPEMIRKIEPTFMYEKEEGYWKLQSALIKLEQLRKFYVLSDRDIPAMRDAIKAKKENLTGLQEVIDKMKEGD